MVLLPRVTDVVWKAQPETTTATYSSFVSQEIRCRCGRTRKQANGRGDGARCPVTHGSLYLQAMPDRARTVGGGGGRKRPRNTPTRWKGRPPQRFTKEECEILRNMAPFNFQKPLPPGEAVMKAVRNTTGLRASFLQEDILFTQPLCEVFPATAMANPLDGHVQNTLVSEAVTLLHTRYVRERARPSYHTPPMLIFTQVEEPPQAWKAHRTDSTTTTGSECVAGISRTTQPSKCMCIDRH